MVDQHILEDLMSYGIKTLCCGDMAQLPAIVKQNNLLENPDYNLTKIMRQQGDSVILKLAEMAKNGVSIPIGNYGDAIVV
jgi:exodeoxyribonuclease-5